MLVGISRILFSRMVIIGTFDLVIMCGFIAGFMGGLHLPFQDFCWGTRVRGEETCLLIICAFDRGGFVFDTMII